MGEANRAIGLQVDRPDLKEIVERVRESGNIIRALERDAAERGAP